MHFQNHILGNATNNTKVTNINVYLYMVIGVPVSYVVISYPGAMEEHGQTQSGGHGAIYLQGKVLLPIF